MSANSTDERLFFNAAPEKTLQLGVDGTSRALDARLRPGKYQCRATGLGVNTMWLILGKFEAGSPLVATAPAAPAAGVTERSDEFPLDANQTSFVLHVRKGVNDGLAAIMSAGSATLVLTRSGQ